MEKNFDFIKKLLNNAPLLRWVKKFSADGLQEQDNGKNFDVECSPDSLALTDIKNVKMFFSNADFIGKRYAVFRIEEINEALSLLGKEGKLIVSEDDKRLCYIESEGNVVVIAPFSEENKKEKKAKKSKEDSEESLEED